MSSTAKKQQVRVFLCKYAGWFPSYQRFSWCISFTFNISPSEPEWWFVATNICTTKLASCGPENRRSRLPPARQLKSACPLEGGRFGSPWRSDEAHRVLRKWFCTEDLTNVYPNWWLWRGNSFKLCSYGIHVRLDFRDVWRQLLHGWPQETTHFNFCKSKSLPFSFFLETSPVAQLFIREVLTLELCLLGDSAKCTFWRSNSTKSHHMRTWSWCEVTWWYLN